MPLKPRRHLCVSARERRMTNETSRSKEATDYLVGRSPANGDEVAVTFGLRKGEHDGQ